MAIFEDSMQDVMWTAPDGTSFKIKTLSSGYSQKHIGEVKENPRTSVSHSTSTKGAKKGNSSSSSSVSTSSSKKRVGDSNDTFTDLGIGGRDVSLDCYFIGDNHYSESNAFRKALCQIGKSKLQLAYGEEFTVNVLNFEVKNSLVERINSTIITVNWHETSPSTYPKSEKSKQKEIKSTVAKTKENLASTVEETAKSIQSPSRLASFTNKFQGALTKVSNALDTASNVSLNSIMSDIMGQDLISNSFTITSQLGVIFQKAANLTNQTKNIGNSFDLPSSYSSLFGGWQALVNSLKTDSLKSTISSNYTPEQVDELKLNDSIASSAIVSVAESLLNTNFETRAEAVEAAKSIVDLNDSWSDFVDEESSRIVDLGDAFIRDENVLDVVLKAANEILDRSYKLKVEQKITLSEDKTPIELAYEFYNESFRENPDSTLDYLIRTNNFTDDDFFLIPRGREVKIYI